MVDPGVIGAALLIMAAIGFFIADWAEDAKKTTTKRTKKSESKRSVKLTRKSSGKVKRVRRKRISNRRNKDNTGGEEK